ncbi:hypothetical protein HanIR_Chr15g0780191 [Helianthus annuus]|nr:hypothetical protein HanIR_Chr15g0780191 [Helianthus annuus]
MGMNCTPGLRSTAPAARVLAPLWCPGPITTGITLNPMYSGTTKGFELGAGYEYCELTCNPSLIFPLNASSISWWLGKGSGLCGPNGITLGPGGAAAMNVIPDDIGP